MYIHIIYHIINYIINYIINKLKILSDVEKECEHPRSLLSCTLIKLISIANAQIVKSCASRSYQEALRLCSKLFCHSLVFIYCFVYVHMFKNYLFRALLHKQTRKLRHMG